MKKFLLSLAVLATAVTVSAQFTTLIPNGDFEAGNTNWTEATGGPTFAYETSGGNFGGYASIDATGGEWAVLVSPVDPGATGGGIPIGDLGVISGVLNTFSIDLKTFSGAAGGGMKVEAWGGNALLGNSGDINAPGAFSDWTTFTFDWTVPAGTDKMIFVPLWGDTSLVGYDNVGVVNVPEPSTFAFIGGFIALGFVVYRRRKQA